MSLTLFKNTLKNNWLLWVIFTAVLLMYSTVMLTMYNPQDITALEETLKMLPESIINAFNMGQSTVGGITAYLANYLYGMLMMAFPMVYTIMLALKLVAKPVDNGSFAYLLSTPNSRTKIITTQAVYALLSLALMFAVVFGIGVSISAAMFPGEMDIWQYLRLNVLTMCLQMAVFMISFFFSCVFCESKKATAFGAGLPIALMLMNMLGGMSADLEPIKKASLFGLYDTVSVAAGGADILGFCVLYIAIAAALFAGGAMIFKRKRLPL